MFLNKRINTILYLFIRKVFSSFPFMLLLIFICPVASASGDHGVYLGVDVGYSNANYETVQLAYGYTFRSVDDSGLAPQFTFGYRFNRIAGLELSVIYFHKIIFHGVGVHPERYDKLKHNLVYLAGKFLVPVYKGFGVYVKAGVGYVVRDRIMYGTIGARQDLFLLKEGEFIRPVYGLGLNYQVTEHWILDATWVGSPEKESDQLPSSNFFGAGASYLF